MLQEQQQRHAIHAIIIIQCARRSLSSWTICLTVFLCLPPSFPSLVPHCPQPAVVVFSWALMGVTSDGRFNSIRVRWKLLSNCFRRRRPICSNNSLVSVVVFPIHLLFTKTHIRVAYAFVLETVNFLLYVAEFIQFYPISSPTNSSMPLPEIPVGLQNKVHRSTEYKPGACLPCPEVNTTDKIYHNWKGTVETNKNGSNSGYNSGMAVQKCQEFL